jgi:CheY-like chemotaxis protein
MSKVGPIIIVEDDADDHRIFEEILQELKILNKLIWFTRTENAFEYLKTTSDQPFIIFSDVNLPIESGIEFKRNIDNDSYLREKSIPFVFYSTSVDQIIVNKAYTEMTVQGFFQKESSYDNIKRMIEMILTYWKTCKHPNSI